MQDVELLTSGLTEFSILEIVKKLCAAIIDNETGICNERKIEYLNRFSFYKMKGEQTRAILQYYDILTHTDIKYLLCFTIGMEYGDIQNLFHIEKKTVYSVRYRIRKKLRSHGGAVLLLP